jgi:hypothetical protein
MRKLSLLLLIVAIFSGCSMNRYLLTDMNKDKRFLVEKIKENNLNGSLTGNPIIVIDGLPYRYEFELKKNRLPLSKNEIDKIEVLRKDIGKGIYGDFAKGGVVVITTKAYRNKNSEAKEEQKILILLDDKIISKKEMEKINPNDVETITIWKDDKEKIKQYTSEDYDGVIIIHMKK